VELIITTRQWKWRIKII